MQSISLALGGVAFALVFILAVFATVDKPLTPEPADVDAIGQLLERLQ